MEEVEIFSDLVWLKCAQGLVYEYMGILQTQRQEASLRGFWGVT